MPLTEEIKQAAQALGQALRTSPTVEDYLKLKARAESDPETAAIELRRAALYPSLSGQEPESDSARSEYFALLKRTRYHPILSARDVRLNIVKGYFAQAGSEMSAILGADYTSLVSKAQ